MDTTHLMTMMNCSKCTSAYYKTTEWHNSECPMCVIEEKEWNYDWVCGYDPPSRNLDMYSNVSPDEWFYVVVEKNIRYRLISKRLYLLRPNKFGKIYFSNKLKVCLEWIKKQLIP